VSTLEGLSNYLGSQVRVLYDVSKQPLEQLYAKQSFVTSPGGPHGLTGEYFDNQELSGKPALSRVDPTISFRWGLGSFAPGHSQGQFSPRWLGYFIPPSTGSFKFYTSSDDGIRLYLSGKRVIDDWTPHSEMVDSYSVHLEAGKAYEIKLEYFDAGGGASVGFGVVKTEETVTENLLAPAKAVDAVIVCVGFDPNSESEGFDRTFELPGAQNLLIQKLAAANKNTIVVLNAGGGVDMSSWLDQVPAVLHAWYPGQENGVALAQILFGEYSPSGKLPISFERRLEDGPTYNSYHPRPGSKSVAYTEGIFLGYRQFDRSTVKPLFPFGYDLSYTSFQYSDLRMSQNSQEITVSFTVKNIGKRRGAQVAQVYVGDSHSHLPRPVKELKGFVKLDLNAGEERSASVALDRRSFAYYDTTGKQWKVDPGKFRISVGSSSDRMELEGTVTLTKSDVESLADRLESVPKGRVKTSLPRSSNTYCPTVSCTR